MGLLGATLSPAFKCAATGTLPPAWSALTQMQRLPINNNRFTGVLDCPVLHMSGTVWSEPVCLLRVIAEDVVWHGRIRLTIVFPFVTGMPLTTANNFDHMSQICVLKMFHLIAQANYQPHTPRSATCQVSIQARPFQRLCMRFGWRQASCVSTRPITLPQCGPTL